MVAMLRFYLDEIRMWEKGYTGSFEWWEIETYRHVLNREPSPCSRVTPCLSRDDDRKAMKRSVLSLKYSVQHAVMS